ncbi:uncharacterized protein MYCFIDRAFT_148855 [Pseudocercospora fijiensis CIRAD86]|uniref:Glutamyl-tRNA amidotransferase complex subunit Gta3 domain-containing protein n=1 Tax=Pseudocercospora fijiensis (strain CIRAD86) TaxID=383855 RepID=N1QAX4_PSEFD|nr:uncharacterized protein MYCFIDRAFT_148855 [Pseudocercospora fijiensis CIRAD86]EME88222.1 hypothetical protein MYCFIDRAFT_148855 [Pseudocercospora fijiensis CIRAD86]
MSLPPPAQLRSYSTSPVPVRRDQSGPRRVVELGELLSQPTWSVASLLPALQDGMPKVSSQQLHHLLRLSALPPPKDLEEEGKMLATLSSQLHFVRDIQRVNTEDVKPLSSLRDETSQGEKEAELGMNALKSALANEELRGQHHKRVRRKHERQQGQDQEQDRWDVLGNASKKTGRYFVVEGGRQR